MPADAGTCVPPAGDYAFCGTATATSEYSSSYAASLVNDGSLDTSWYSASSTCPAGVCGTTLSVDIALDVPRTIGRVKLFGNRDYPTGYDTLTARIQLLDVNGAVVHTADVATGRGLTEPNGDLDSVVAPAVACVATVRVIVLTGEGDGPGLAEVQAFAN
jgi:hypothetical protein